MSKAEKTITTGVATAIFGYVAFIAFVLFSLILGLEDTYTWHAVASMCIAMVGIVVFAAGLILERRAWMIAAMDNISDKRCEAYPYMEHLTFRRNVSPCPNCVSVSKRTVCCVTSEMWL